MVAKSHRTRAPEEYDRMIRNRMEIFTKVARSAGLLAK